MNNENSAVVHKKNKVAGVYTGQVQMIYNACLMVVNHERKAEFTVYDILRHCPLRIKQINKRLRELIEKKALFLYKRRGAMGEAGLSVNVYALDDRKDVFSEMNYAETTVLYATLAAMTVMQAAGVTAEEIAMYCELDLDAIRSIVAIMLKAGNLQVYSKSGGVTEGGHQCMLLCVPEVLAKNAAYQAMTDMKDEHKFEGEETERRADNELEVGRSDWELAL